MEEEGREGNRSTGTREGRKEILEERDVGEYVRERKEENEKK